MAVSGPGHRERMPAAFIAVSSLVFLGSATAACIECSAMSAMGAMPLPAGGSVSMMWMPMHGGTWAGTLTQFITMWLLMMTAMMLPSFAPTLWRRCRSFAPASRVRCAMFLTLGYSCTWLIVGIGVFAACALLTNWRLGQPFVSRAVPIAAAVAVLVGAAVQCSPWKVRQLICCRQRRACASTTRSSSAAAFRWGLRHGLHCNNCCAGLNLAMLTIGVMDLKVMGLVMAAITLERFAPNAERAAHAIGCLMGIAGVCLLAQSTPL